MQIACILNECKVTSKINNEKKIYVTFCIAVVTYHVFVILAIDYDHQAGYASILLAMLNCASFRRVAGWEACVPCW